MLFESECKQLLKASKNGRIPLRAFKDCLPAMAAQMKTDRKCDFFKLWGECENYDEYAQETIVDPKLLNLIGRAAGYRIRSGGAYHAGLVHTYGYLLSTLNTRFGFKHERWTDGALEKGLGLSPCQLWSQERSYSLFQNVSFLLYRIIRENGGILKRVNLSRTNVCPELAEYDYGALQTQSLVENVQAGRKRWTIRSRIVTLPNIVGQKLLVYTIQAGRKPEMLVTAFPVSSKAADQLLSDDIGEGRPIRLRYNAFISKFPADACGSRLAFTWS